MNTTSILVRSHRRHAGWCVAMLSASVVLAISVSSGCNHGPELASVEGTVTYRGKPLETGKIMFVPASGRTANGRIENGKIVAVSTFALSDGALTGDHRVAIFSFVGNPTGMEAVIPWAIPKRYGAVGTSGLAAKVVAPGPNEFQFELKD